MVQPAQRHSGRASCWRAIASGGQPQERGKQPLRPINRFLFPAPRWRAQHYEDMLVERFFLRLFSRTAAVLFEAKALPPKCITRPERRRTQNHPRENRLEHGTILASRGPEKEALS
jgi:hypothetical protein